MTTAERLVRNACDQRTQEVEREKIQVPPEKVRVADLDAPLRRALLDYYKYDKLRDEAKAVVEKAGYDVPYQSCGGTPTKISRDRTVWEKEKHQALAGRRERLAKIEKLKTQASIQVLGISPTSARVVIQQLEKDLAAV
jgi:hypothetical protein